MSTEQATGIVVWEARIVVAGSIALLYLWLNVSGTRNGYWHWLTNYFVVLAFSEVYLYWLSAYQRMFPDIDFAYVSIFQAVATFWYIVNTTVIMILVIAAHKLTDRRIHPIWSLLYAVPIISILYQGGSESAVWLPLNQWAYNYFRILGPLAAFSLIAFRSPRWWMQRVMRIITIVLGILWYAQNFLWAWAGRLWAIPDKAHLTGIFLDLLMGGWLLLLHLRRVEVQRDDALAKLAEERTLLDQAVQVAANGMEHEAAILQGQETL